MVKTSFYEWLPRISVNKLTNLILIQTYFLSKIKNSMMMDPVSFMQKIESLFLPELSLNKK